MSTNPNDYAPWRRLLAGERVDIHDGEPLVGFYAIGTGDRRVPVNIYKSEAGAFFAWRGAAAPNGKAVPVHEVWPRCASGAVPHADWLHAYNTGEWPGASTSAPVIEPPIAASVIGTAIAAGVDIFDGDNAPEDELHAKLLDDVDRLEREIAALKSDQGDLGAEIKAKITKLQKQIKEAYSAEVKPHLDATEVVRTKWRGVTDRAAEIMGKITTKLTAFLNAKKAAEREAAAKAVAAGKPIEEVAAAIPAKTTAGGSGTRKVAMVKTYYAEVTDFDALYAHVKAQPLVQEALQKVADTAAKNQITLPGMTIRYTEKAR